MEVDKIMKVIPFTVDYDPFPLIENGRQLLTENKERIQSIMSRAINREKYMRPLSDTECMIKAKEHHASLDIATFKIEDIDEDIIRGYDLIIRQFKNSKGDDLATIVFILREFLHTGEVRFVIPSSCFMPKKERDKHIADIDKKLEKANRLHRVWRMRSEEEAENFIIF
jgi:hypothetical protein